MKPEPGGWHFGKCGADDRYVHAGSSGGVGTIITRNGLYPMFHFGGRGDCDRLELTLNEDTVFRLRYLR